MVTEKNAPTHSVRDGYHVYQTGDGPDYWDIVQRFRDGTLPGKQLSNASRERDVFLLETPEGRFVLKWDRGGWGFGGEGRFERFFWRFVRGPYYSRLFRRVDRAWHDGCRAMQRVYLAAERRTLHFCHEAYVLLEYVEGHELGDQGDQAAFREAVARCAADLHAHGLAVCDINEHNFLVVPGGVRAIDLVCRGNARLDRIKDTVRLKRVMDIDLPVHGLVDRILLRGMAAFQEYRRRRVEKKRQRRALSREKYFRSGPKG